MANRNFNGVQINQSVTIVEQAGAEIADVRNRIMAYDGDGNVVLAADGSVVPVGIALIESGVNDISGVESGKVNTGDDVDIQIKDIGYILAGGEIAKGKEVTASNGLAVTAESGNYVVGIALSAVAKDEYCRVQITKYQKA
uniref:hypothetical protein n=1 Tax=Enterocloster clostridioformis TaxID=1531 RepID=UPI0026769A75|nr:hypothetical protein [Enterocloster clostridioformis]